MKGTQMYDVIPKFINKFVCFCLFVGSQIYEWKKFK